MKNILFALLLSFITTNVFAQGLAVNGTGATADASAMLDVSAANKGLLVPRMTLTQRTAIATPATGLLVYQTDGLNGFYYNAGTPAVPNWIRLSAENYWTLNGSNNIYNNNSGGFVGIGTTTPNAPLQFATDTRNRKIVLFEVVNNDHQFYGFGVNGGILRYQAGTGVDNHVFYAGTSSTTSSELMRITGAGNVGIGSIVPGYRLDVNDRMRIRSVDATTNSAGIWLNASTNTERAFVGMENDNSVGLFGNNGAGWAFVMNTQIGKIRYQDGTQANGRILSCDANGTASWVNSSAITPAVYGVFIAGGVNLTTSMPWSYMQAYIDLPPGRWIVFGNFLASQGGTGGPLTSAQAMWIRTTLSSSNVANINPGDIVGSGLISGPLIGPSQFGLVSGQIIVNNTSGTTRRYYVWGLMTAGTSGGQPTGFALDGLGSNFWQENQLIGVPMN